MKLVAGLRNSITDVAGVLVGQYQQLDAEVTRGSGAATGCTVVRLPGGATTAVDVRGAAPGTRETDVLASTATVTAAHAVLLTGGSAFGLAAADGVMQWLAQAGEGVPMDPDDPAKVVPIVPAAVIFDLTVGAWEVRPTAEYGYHAAHVAGAEVARGCVGAGTGAMAGAVKGGVGTASVRFGEGPAAGHTVGALVVVNCAGSVFDPSTGLLWCDSSGGDAAATADRPSLGATTIGVVATDATLARTRCARLAVAAHDGLARAVRPAHGPTDGDTFFAVATGRAPVADDERAQVAALGQLCSGAAVAVERAIVDAVLAAHSVAGIPCYAELFAKD